MADLDLYNQGQEDKLESLRQKFWKFANSNKALLKIPVRDLESIAFDLFGFTEEIDKTSAGK